MWRGIGYNIRNQNRRKKSNLLFHPFLQDSNTLLTFPQEGTGVCAPEGAVQRGTYSGALSLHSLRPANAGSCSKPNCKCLYFHGHDVCIQWCRLKYCYCSCLIKQALLLKLHSHDGTFPAIHNEYPPHSNTLVLIPVSLCNQSILQPDGSPLLIMLEDVMTIDRNALGHTLVRFYLAHGSVLPLLDTLTTREIHLSSEYIHA